MLTFEKLKLIDCRRPNAEIVERKQKMAIRIVRRHASHDLIVHVARTCAWSGRRSLLLRKLSDEP